tara:strand:- start:1879 stop:2493 length:615 start_codon:yes stop_codon:yes gene_type:complete
MIQPYASRTGTKRNLKAMRRNGFGLLISATGVHRDEGFSLIGLDNGAWTAFQSGEPWERGLFELLVAQFAATAEWIVIPDVVTDAAATFGKAKEWIPLLHGLGRRRLLAVQDGMTCQDVSPFIGDHVGIFLGGSTDFKWSTIDAWGDLARRRGAYFHVGRVNTRRAITSCQLAGADSFDGTSATMFSVNADKIGHASRQEVFKW